MLELSMRQKLALGHCLTALAMSRQWSKDFQFYHRIPEDEEALIVVNEMLKDTAFYDTDPIKKWCTTRCNWPRI